MEALSHLRSIIATLDEALVDSLCLRATRRLNDALYSMPDEPPPALQALAGLFADAPTLAGRIHVLRPAYLRVLLPALCDPGQDTGQPACLSADGACLDALARRLALSVHVATRKREAIPEALQAALKSGSATKVEQAITNPDVEAEVLARIQARARTRASQSEVPGRIAGLYTEWIIPLSRKIQVHGLLAAVRKP
jgi:chorismate mutase